MFLDPTAPFGRFPHLIGQSGGGKGTLGRLWSSLAGENAAGSATAFSDISTPEGRHQYLTGQKIFAFPDVGGYSQGLRAFYELIDNGSMTGRALFNPVAYSKLWYCRFWVASVDHLQVENAGDGWARRAYLIPVRERTLIPDPDLRNKLEAVKAQVISWALAMPRAERDAILLSPPASDRVKSLALDAALYGDSARSFVDLCLRPSSDSSAIVPHSQLHTWYVSYCQQHGYTPLGQSKFISHLRTVLPRNHVDRGWSPMVNGERSRLPAHWQGISPVLGVFVSSGEGEMQFPQNPQWICLKAKCIEGGLEEFEDYWNRLPDPPKPLETLSSAGVQGVQPQNSENQGVDSLKPLSSAGVQGGSTVQGESFGVDSKLNDASLQAENDSLRVKTLGGQNGQGGQVDVEPVSAVPANLDRVDRVDHSTLLPQDAVQRAVDQMAAIDSVESFQQFYDLYQRCSQIQQQVMDAFTTQVDNEQQIRFYQCWQQFEAPELAVEPELTQASVQEPVKSVGCNQWVYARLSQAGGETLVRVLSETFDSLTVHVPGRGSQSIKSSQVIRVSSYRGD
jgi:putative DNA primase/helicase